MTTSFEEFIKLLPDIAKSERIKTNKKILYYNIPCSFDIEVTSFYEGDSKRAIMYEWTFGIGGYLIYGRKWEEFMQLYYKIVEELRTDETNRLVCFVHNLEYEFQFFRKRFRWARVFSLEERKPVQAVTVEGIEFRCSYKLSGYSLAKLGDELQKYKCKKMVGDLDYDIMRNAKTPLTRAELRYCLNDVLVVMCYIQELIEREGDISKIPLTNTGFVRRLCRKKCLYEGDNKYKDKYLNYRAMMKELTLTPEIYTLLQQAFAGGFTHANAWFQDEVVENVASYDFTSSYPYVMVSEKFPMSKGTLHKSLSKKEFKRCLKNYCCLFEIELFDLKAVEFYENYISRSKCRNVEEAIVNNGRVSRAKHLVITVTEQDYFIIRKMYKWSQMKIRNFYTFVKGYLPTDFVKAILELYMKKTTLKGVPEKAVEYLVSKGQVNSCYGMMVTNICRDEIMYEEDEWGVSPPSIEEAIEKNNKSVKRFLYYPWGVWVTAYARANLFTGIIEFKDDYVYSDTDSIKVIHAERHQDYINAYNKAVEAKLRAACSHHKIDFSCCAPLTIKGEAKMLGVWDYEGTYTRFKTLGAKRYLTEEKRANQLVQHLTVAGLSKSIALSYMQELAEKQGKDVFDVFDDTLYIPKGRTGKLLHTYIDDECSGYMTDYLGNTCYYEELSAVHLEPADYSLSITEEYLNFVLGIKTEELRGT